MIYDLPKSLEIQGVEYEVRSDYRAILDILIALSDPELDEQDKAIVALQIFYPDYDEIPVEALPEAVKRCFWFINGGEEEQQPAKALRLMDWEQDFKFIIAPVNRVIGKEVREMEYLHWWAFLSAYMEIGECTFSQIVAIREKQKRGKKLEKYEQEWLKRNRHLVEFKRKYTDADNDLIDKWV